MSEVMVTVVAASLGRKKRLWCESRGVVLVLVLVLVLSLSLGLCLTLCLILNLDLVLGLLLSLVLVLVLMVTVTVVIMAVSFSYALALILVSWALGGDLPAANATRVAVAVVVVDDLGPSSTVSSVGRVVPETETVTVDILCVVEMGAMLGC